MPEPISAPAACTPPGDSPPVLGFVRSRSPRFRHSSASLSSGRSGSALAGNVRCCLPTRPCFRSSVSRRVPADTVLSGRDSAPLRSPERRGPCPWPGFPGSLLHRKWRTNTHTHTQSPGRTHYLPDFRGFGAEYTVGSSAAPLLVLLFLYALTARSDANPRHC